MKRLIPCLLLIATSAHAEWGIGHVSRKDLTYQLTRLNITVDKFIKIHQDTLDLLNQCQEDLKTMNTEWPNGCRNAPKQFNAKIGEKIHILCPGQVVVLTQDEPIEAPTPLCTDDGHSWPCDQHFFTPQ